MTYTRGGARGSREQSYSGDHERAKRSANSKGCSLSLSPVNFREATSDSQMCAPHWPAFPLLPFPFLTDDLIERFAALVVGFDKEASTGVD